MRVSLASKAAFAKLVGVSVQAIHKACRDGGSLVIALEGAKLNTLHPAAITYAESHGVRVVSPKSAKPAKSKSKTKPATGELVERSLPVPVRAHLQTKSRFARTVGVSAQAIGKAVKTVLAPAMVGDKIDPSHRAAVQYAAAQELKRGVDSDRAELRELEEGLEVPVGPAIDLELLKQALGEDDPCLDDVEKAARLPVADVINIFGDVKTLNEWLDSHRKRNEISLKRLAIAESEGKLIARELVEVHLIGLIEATFRRLLTDVPKTIAARVSAAANGGKSLEDSEKLVRDLLSSQLEPLKAGAAKALRSA